MAKIIPVLGAASGSMGGIVFSHNKGGAYTRARKVPTNPTSGKQSAIRAILATLSASWAGLSDADKNAWSVWAAVNPIVDSLGASIFRTGHQAYVGLNSRLVQAGDAASDTPPGGTGPTDLVTLTVTATAPFGISAAYTATPLPAGTRILLWQTLPASPGRNPNRRQARLIGISAAAAASPLVVTSQYAAVVGQVSNFWAQVMDANGQVSPGIRDQGTFI